MRSFPDLTSLFRAKKMGNHCISIRHKIAHTTCSGSHTAAQKGFFARAKTQKAMMTLIKKASMVTPSFIAGRVNAKNKVFSSDSLSVCIALTPPHICERGAT